jgi:peptidoglycan/xylan/chitin deacetylase (PgdA/CDA1 family)
LVLIHHEIAPTQGDPAKDLLPALGADLFRAQLEHLKRRYAVVPLSDLAARAAERERGEPLPVALTFDDDLANHAAVAAPILSEFGFPATFFLCARSLNGPSPLWLQDLQAILDAGPESWPDLQAQLARDWPWARLADRPTDLLLTIETLPRAEHDAIGAKLREIAEPRAIDAGLSSEAVKSLVDGGFEVGFHTLGHYDLQTLAANELEEAMQEGLDELEKVIGRRPTSIAYPYGRADLRVADAAREAGFERGFIGAHAATTPDQHPMLMARVVGWTESLDAFSWALARLSATA